MHRPRGPGVQRLGHVGCAVTGDLILPPQYGLHGDTSPPRTPRGTHQAPGQQHRSALYVDGRRFPYLNGFCGGWRPVSVFPIAW